MQRLCPAAVCRIAAAAARALLKWITPSSTIRTVSHPEGNDHWTFERVLERFAPDLEAIEKSILGNLNSRNEILGGITSYISRSGGKRLRPLLVCLCARLNGYEGPDHIALGNVVEYLHAATLLHDDVLDNATVRRGAPSANDKWGNHFAVLGGDYLYTSAFDILLAGFQRDIIKILCRSSLDMIEGEVLQRQWLGRLDLSEETYFRIIALKTASLIAGSCRSGALLGGAGEEDARALADFGELVGTAFQIIDDTLDYTADPDQLGKKIGGDLQQGTVTLPLIYLMEEPAAAGDLDGFSEMIASGSVDDGTVRRIVELLHEHDCAGRAMAKAAEYARSSKEKIRPFSASPVYPALLAAADFIIDRSH